jgi:thermitase
MIRRFRPVLVVCFVCGASAQINEQPFYWYQGRKILLTKASDVVAAKVLAGVDYQRKFSWLPKSFSSAGTSALLSEPVLLQNTKTSLDVAKDALASGIRSHELYPLDVFQVGDTKLILQNEIIVRFHDGTTTSVLAEALLGRFSKVFTRQRGAGLRYLIHLGNPTITLAVADMLYRNNTAAYAEPNFVIVQPAGPHGATPRLAVPVPPAGGTPTVAVFPSDPLFPRQWGLAKIGAPKAWITTQGLATIRIAVIDDGVDVGHEDLKDKIYQSYDMLRDTDVMNPPPADSHGTAVAGVAAAATNNALGVAGLAANVKLIPIRMLSYVSPDSVALTVQTITNSFEKAVDLNADVINCSWSMPTPFDDVKAEIEAVAAKGRNGAGTVMIFAAGNTGGPVAFPANLTPSLPIIAVGASNQNDEFKTASSSDGETDWASNYGSELTVVAPGVKITTTAHTGSVPPGTPPYTDGYWGTSAATPFVSGLAALILSVDQALSPTQVRDRIVSSADKVVRMPGPGGAMIGRINACKALGRSDCGQ